MTSVDAHLRLVRHFRRTINATGVVPEEPATVGEVQVAIAAERLREVVTAVDDAHASSRRRRPPQADAHVLAWRDLERAMAEWRPGDDPPWPGTRGMDLSRLRSSIELMLPPDDDAIAEAEALVRPTAWIDDLALPDRPPTDAPLWRLLVYPVQRWWQRWRAVQAEDEQLALATNCGSHGYTCCCRDPACTNGGRFPGECEIIATSIRQRKQIEALRAKKAAEDGRPHASEVWQRDGEPWTCESWPSAPSVEPPESGRRNG